MTSLPSRHKHRGPTRGRGKEDIDYNLVLSVQSGHFNRVYRLIIVYIDIGPCCSRHNCEWRTGLRIFIGSASLAGYKCTCIDSH